MDCHSYRCVCVYRRRLWPTYLFVLLLYIHLSVYVGEGFLWDQYTGYINTRCEKWWTNMLFVNNVCF